MLASHAVSALFNLLTRLEDLTNIHPLIIRSEFDCDQSFVIPSETDVVVWDYLRDGANEFKAYSGLLGIHAARELSTAPQIYLCAWVTPVSRSRVPMRDVSG